jgi:hypothetical protein
MFGNCSRFPKPPVAFRTQALAAVVALMLSTLASGAQSVTAPRVVPGAIPVNTPTVVTVRAQVGPDPSLITGSVNLVEITPTGETILGSLYDDGTHGDTVSGDSVYAGQFSLTSSTPGQIQLIVTAAFRGSMRRVASAIFPVITYLPLSTADAQIPISVQHQAQQLFDASRAQVGDVGARANVISSLLQQPGVRTAGLASDGTSIWIEYTSGLRGSLLTGSANSRGGPRPARRISARSATPAGGPRGCIGASFLPFAELNHSSANDALPPAAFIFAPLAVDSAIFGTEASDVANLLASTCTGKPTPFLNGDATVSALSNIENYSLILFITHGGLANVFGVEAPQLLTAEPYSWPAHPADFILGHLRICTIGGTYAGDYTCVLPAFFSAHLTRQFPQSIVYADACETVGNDAKGYNFALMDAFLQNGASSFLGWKNSVNGAFAAQTAGAVFNLIAAAPSDVTIGGAYGSISPQDPGATVESVNVTAGGSGYTAPVVTFSAPPAGGRTALGEATVVNGSITGVTLYDSGDGYSSPPTITFNDPTGTGAAATATAPHAVLAFGGQAGTTLCSQGAVSLSPYGPQSLSTAPGPYTVQFVDRQLNPVAAPNDISITIHRDVTSQCHSGGPLFSSDSTVLIPQGQVSATYGFVAGRDPNCNNLPITSTFTVKQALAAPNNSVLDLSVVPTAQLTLSVVR